jgi:hypothetical protein
VVKILETSAVRGWIRFSTLSTWVSVKIRTYEKKEKMCLQGYLGMVIVRDTLHLLTDNPLSDGGGFKGFLPQLDEFYFTTDEKENFGQFRCIVPNFIND